MENLENRILAEDYCFQKFFWTALKFGGGYHAVDGIYNALLSEAY